MHHMTTRVMFLIPYPPRVPSSRVSGSWWRWQAGAGESLDGAAARRRSAAGGGGGAVGEAGR